MMSIQEIQAGTVVGHRYRIEKSLGRGPSGTVYICRDLLDGGGNVSVKVIRMKDCGECQMAQLRRQLSVLARLRHPNLARILDFGTIAERNEPFLVQEYVDGKNLFEATGDRVSHEMIRLLVELCRALRYLHAREVLHCNLKPSNVLLSPGNGGGAGIKLLDFGLNGLPRGSKRESMLGTLGYTAPEVILGQPPTIKSDLYSLGVVAYQLFARRLPFEDEDHEYLIQKQLQGSADLRPIERLESGPGLVQVLRGLLEKDPDRRPSSTDEVIRLLSVASGRDFSSVIEPSREHYFSASRFVGRDNELRTLQGACNEIRQSGRGAAYFITGEAGLGKTRLLEELRTWCLMDGWRVIEAGCLPGEGESYEVYRKILHRFDRVGAAAQGASVDEIFRFESLPRPAEAGLLQPSTESAASRFRDHLTRELVKRLSDAPSVLLLHDFHWADDANTAVLDYLISDISVQPVFVCVSIRPLKDEQSPLARLMKQAARHQRAGLLTLDPLPEDAVAQMIVSMTGSKELGKSVGNWLYTSSGGNPYFVEETMKHLVDRGVLRQEADRWVLEQSQLQNLEVPKGATVVLRHRLDQLSTTARGVADWISVIKRPVALDLLCRVLSWDAGKARAVLGELIMRQLVRVSEEGASEQYEFRHSLIAEVLYAGIGRSRRRRMHGKIAEVMESLYGPDGCLQELAIHFTEGRVGKKAVGYALKAASLCRAEFAYETALRFFEYVLANPGDLSREEQCQASIDAADIYCALGIPRRAIRLLETQRHQSREGQPDEQSALLLCRLAYAYQCQGHLDRAKTINVLGLRLLNRLQPSSSAENMQATLLMHTAFADLVESRPRHGLALLEPLRDVLAGHGGPEGQLYSLISALHRVACNLRGAVAAAKRALDILLPLDFPRPLAIACSHMGAYLNAEGRFKLAEKYHNLAAATSERARSVFQQAQAFSNLAECLCRSGRLHESLALSSTIRRLAAITDNRDWMDICMGSIIETSLHMGRYSEAYDSLKSIFSRKSSTLPIYVKAQLLYYYGWLFAELGDGKRAREYLKQMDQLGSREAPIYESEMARVLEISVEHELDSRLAIRRLLRVHSQLMGKRRPYQVCLTELRLAEECIRASDHRSAQHWAKRAVKLAKAMPAVHLESLGHLRFGTALFLQASSLDASGPDISFQDQDRKDVTNLARTELLTAADLGRAAGVLETTWRASALLAEIEDLVGNHDNAVKHAIETVTLLDELERMVPAQFLALYRTSSDRLTTRRKCRHLIEVLGRTSETSTTELDGTTERHFASLYRISNVLNRIRDLEKLSARIVESLALALDMERGRLYLVDADRQLKLASESSRNQASKTLELFLEALVNHTWQEGGVFITAAAQNDVRLKEGAFGHLDPLGTLFIASIKTYGKTLGVLCCHSVKAVDRIDSSQISFFGAFANMAAVAIDNAIAHQTLRDEAADLEQCLEHAKRGLIGILGDSAAAVELRHRIAMVAQSPLDVLVTGETGTGKELVARALHQCGKRSECVFVAVDCGALSETLFESELFGYRKGSFTGATENRAGLLEAANGGVIFLDEISNLSLRSQAKLLRVVQEREVRRIGDGALRKLDIQVIAATNIDLWPEIKKGKFRRDLYFRLKSTEIRIPPLRERREDIPLLIDWFLSRVSQSNGCRKSVSPEAYKRLTRYSYPGNVRELKNNIESAYYLSKDTIINVSDLQPELQGISDSSADISRVRDLYDSLREGRATFEEAVKRPFLNRILNREAVKGILRLALTDSHGKYREAFRLLGIPSSSYSVMMLFLKRHGCYLDFRFFRRR
jgi:transcriptional regulator with GAF, ATPase, and Fis domain